MTFDWAERAQRYLDALLVDQPIYASTSAPNCFIVMDFQSRE